MMRRLAARSATGALLALAAATPAAAQALQLPPVAWPHIADRAMSAEGFVPPQWRIEHRVEGRLDDDPAADLLLLLRMDEPANVIEHEGMGTSPFDSNPRMLVIAFADGQGGYRRELVDHQLIPRAESPLLDDVLRDDAPAMIQIRGNRSFAITLHSFASAGSWSSGDRQFTFRHQDGCFRLIGFDDTQVHRGSGEITRTSINYLTGGAWRSTGSIEDDAEPPKQWQTLPPSRRLVCIEQIGDGFVFDPALP
jgi:hypothetical protein